MPEALTGRWVGHYVQRGQQRGIAAEFRQSGSLLTGTMRDVQTEFEMSLFEMAAEAGWPPGADEQLGTAMRDQFPESTGESIRWAYSLPADSEIEGQVRDGTVSFLKSYRGESFHGFRVGERRVGETTPGHGVNYQGRLSVDGNTLEGTWWIEAKSEQGTRRTEGMFLLRREQPNRPRSSSGMQE
jgi:hypothetical protein